MTENTDSLQRDSAEASGSFKRIWNEGDSAQRNS